MIAGLVLSPATGRAQEADLRLAMPQAMIDNGFATHLLPRFRFKHRIRVAPVAADAAADMALTATAEGRAVFADDSGTVFRLNALAADDERAAKIAKFLQWLKSGPGKAAIAGFQLAGRPLYTASDAAPVVKAVVAVDGDAQLGARLAIVHCGRCHVVDKRNRMGGIGSTPSFGALRGRDDWRRLFQDFWTENPHPSFTQVAGVTEPFADNRPAHVAPVEITVEEIEAITAFAATLTPKDLGNAVVPQ